jgi:AcrR family transcriptional regulator
MIAVAPGQHHRVGAEVDDPPRMPAEGKASQVQQGRDHDDHQQDDHFPAGPRRILLAAATAFAERGFHATTTRDIAAQAGLSSAALYFYFRSKEEVLYQIATSALDFTIEVAATEAKGPGSPAERLTNLVRVLTICHTYNSQVAHVVLYQTSALTTGHLADIAAKQRTPGGLTCLAILADPTPARGTHRTGWRCNLS